MYFLDFEMIFHALGVPVAMSTPHFLNGYEPYWKDTGLSPDAQKHETYIDIEPVSFPYIF